MFKPKDPRDNKQIGPPPSLGPPAAVAVVHLANSWSAIPRDNKQYSLELAYYLHSMMEDSKSVEAISRSAALATPPVARAPGVEVCLITDEALTDTAIRLTCGHSFNYEPLLRDMTQFRLAGGEHLSAMQIRCPYCRQQHPLLPYLPGFDRVHGVNYVDEERVIYHGKCSMCPCTVVYLLEGVMYCSKHKRLEKQRLAKAAVPKCGHLLKTGKNKGSVCGLPVCIGDTCRRHADPTKNSS